jgi:maleate isomerase
MDAFPYDLTGPIGTRATLGLIVLQTDETIEHDFHRLFADPQIALYVSRVPSGDEVTPDTLESMRKTLPRAAGLLPPAARFDVVGYACTSGSTMIGADAVEALVKQGANTRAVANPLSAALGALDRLGARSVAIVSPYIPAVAQPIRAAFERHGLRVPGTVSFGEEVEARVARIDPASIRAAALSVGRSDEAEAVFLSCTNLRTLDIIDDLEAELGKPVLSSNQALAWQMAERAGGLALANPPGRLFRD